MDLEDNPRNLVITTFPIFNYAKLTGTDGVSLTAEVAAATEKRIQKRVDEFFNSNFHV